MELFQVLIYFVNCAIWTLVSYGLFRLLFKDDDDVRDEAVRESPEGYEPEWEARLEEMRSRLRGFEGKLVREEGLAEEVGAVEGRVGNERNWKKTRAIELKKGVVEGGSGEKTMVVGVVEAGVVEEGVEDPQNLEKNEVVELKERGGEETVELGAVEPGIIEDSVGDRGSSVKPETVESITRLIRGDKVVVGVIEAGMVEDEGKLEEGKSVEEDKVEVGAVEVGMVEDEGGLEEGGALEEDKVEVGVVEAGMVEDEGRLKEGEAVEQEKVDHGAAEADTIEDEGRLEEGEAAEEEDKVEAGAVEAGIVEDEGNLDEGGAVEEDKVEVSAVEVGMVEDEGRSEEEDCDVEKVEQHCYEVPEVEADLVEGRAEKSEAVGALESQGKNEVGGEELFDDWEGIQRSELYSVFGAAAAYLSSEENANHISSIDSNVKMQLYGLYKVATEGPCQEPQPMALRVFARMKWNAWNQLGKMSPESAMEQYVALVSKEIPGWMADDARHQES